MKSPFPGMDPYLEQRWGGVHLKLMAGAIDQLNAVLPNDLVANGEEYVSLEIPDQDWEKHFVPDVGVSELPVGPGHESPAPSTVAVAEPVVLRVTSELQKRRRIVIQEIVSGNRLVTVIEFLSPANKIGSEERDAYRKRRREFLRHGVNYVEIDLLRSGGYVLYPNESLMTDHLNVPYRACVVRATDSRSVAVYPMSIREKLPAFRVPLRPTDRDVVFDLQSLLEQVYEKGKYDRQLDYKKDAVPKLTGEDATWADELLKAAGKR